MKIWTKKQYDLDELMDLPVDIQEAINDEVMKK